MAKFLFSAFAILTSLYCLLAFLPYTYFFVVKEPPYTWLALFVRYHPALSCIALALAVMGWWTHRSRRLVVAALALQTVLTVFLSAYRFVPAIQSNVAAYIVSVIMLVPVSLLMLFDAISDAAEKREASSVLVETPYLFSYLNSGIVVLCVAPLTAIAALITSSPDAGAELKRGSFLSNLELFVLVSISYALLACLTVSLANILILAFGRFRAGLGIARQLAFGILTFIGLFIASSRFLQNCLTLHGVLKCVYAFFLSAALTLTGAAMTRVVFRSGDNNRRTNWRTGLLFVVALLLASFTLILPSFADKDWNGVLQASFVILLWSFFSIFLYWLRLRPCRYSIKAVLAILLISGCLYLTVVKTAFLWAQQLGKTDDEINDAIANYAQRDVSFGLVNQLLAERQSEPCDVNCLTLRQYSNIRNMRLERSLDIVEHLEPTKERRPDIFVIVLDSVRPDYLGAYNPHVDFTPNLDSFAKDSVVFRNVYTQYAGTSLSEPAIWCGAMLPHAHYPRPFSKLNTLQRMLKADGYTTVVSYDPILRQIVDDDSELVKLDTDKKWYEIEFSDTLLQLKSILDKRGTAPIFVYTQPMNVHQFARNKLPVLTRTWMRPGFNRRISYELHQVDEHLGDFFAYLKSRSLYDKSIIIITADHGDATGEFGRHSHSTILFPEVMQVPLIVHLPSEMRQRVVSDPESMHALTDITPTLYYLLQHRPIMKNPVLGQTLFAENPSELGARRTSLFLASDVRAAFGILDENGKYMYVTYDSPPESSLYDLSTDPHALRSVLTDAAKLRYQARVVSYLQSIADFYGYKPNGSIH